MSEAEYEDEERRAEEFRNEILGPPETWPNIYPTFILPNYLTLTLLQTKVVKDDAGDRILFDARLKDPFDPDFFEFEDEPRDVAILRLSDFWTLIEAVTLSLRAGDDPDNNASRNLVNHLAKARKELEVRLEETKHEVKRLQAELEEVKRNQVVRVYEPSF